ncbi:MAG: hypothetical protein ABFS35_12840 [Bacteroidota bacterium]
MKKIVFISSFLIVLLMSPHLASQDLFLPEIEPVLNVEQKVQFEKAVRLLQKASGNVNNAESIERKYSKRGNKGYKRRWEKKTWEAKQHRILAGKNYNSAYKMLSDLYSTLITSASYPSPADKTKALSLNDDASGNFEEANAKLAQIDDISKEQMKLTKYEDCKNNLKGINNLQIEAIRYQISAMEIFLNGGAIYSDESEDNLAWEQAQEENIIDSYHKYLSDNPRGKHMFEANNKIRELEKENGYSDNDVVTTDNKDYKNTNDRELVFKVQIAASKVTLTDWFISAKAPEEENVESVYIDNWNKYMVGSFSSYHEAAKYRDMLRSTAPDAFIVVFKDNIQIQVTKEMKK